MIYSKIVQERDPITYTIIDNAFKSNKVPHAYLFVAQDNRDITDEYKFVIQKLISPKEDREPDTYPDLTVIDGSKGLIKKEFVISAINKLQQTPLDAAGKKILVIRNIENSNKQSINSLLKFIEEPTKDTYILMTTNNLSNVLPTIKSRSQVVKLKNIDIDLRTNELIEEGIDNKYARIFASIFVSKEEALENNNRDFIEAIEEIKRILSFSLNNKNLIVSELGDLIRKDNFTKIIGIIKEFYSDIWREEQLMKISFEDSKDVLQNYALSKFNFAKALKELNMFISDRSFNLNFDAQKNKLLVVLGECYV